MANPFSATPGAANPFGTPAAPAGGGLFGATPAASKPAGGGLFGAATPAPAASGTSLFGATPGAPAGGGLFGATPSAPKPAGGGLFGAATPAASGSSLLGGGTGLFGAPAPAAAGGGLFGAPAAAAPALGGGLFGAPAPAAPALGGGLFGAPAAAPAQPQAAAAPPTVLDQDIFNQFLQQMEAAFNAGKPHQCSFKHMFYDDLTQADGTPPTPQELATRRQQAQAQADPGLWERAEAHNPDPARFCPVQVTGFENLLARQRKQEEMASLLATDLTRMQTLLREIADARQVSIQLRLRHYRARQQQLSHRVLKLVATLESQQHMRTHHGAEPPAAPAERAWAREVRQLTEELRHSERGRPRLLEISGRLQQTQREGGGGGGGLGGGGDAALDPGAARLNVDAVREWLGTHQAGLAKLVEVQHELLEDLAVLQQVNG